MPNILIIGYGNPLRGDDALGQVIAGSLDRQPSEAVDVICCHQLMPELAERLAAVDVAIFVDAVAGAPPGLVAVSPVFAARRPPSLLGHHADPEWLLSLCGELYQRTPRTFLVSVGAASFDIGSSLSDKVARAVPEVISAVGRLISEAPP